MYEWMSVISQHASSVITQHACPIDDSVLTRNKNEQGDWRARGEVKLKLEEKQEQNQSRFSNSPLADI